MTAPTAPSVRDAALDAAVRHHFQSLHSAGMCVPFEQIGDRSRRIVRGQLAGLVDAVLEAVAPAAWRSTEESSFCTVHYDPTCPHGVTSGRGAFCQACEDLLNTCTCGRSDART